MQILLTQSFMLSFLPWHKATMLRQDTLFTTHLGSSVEQYPKQQHVKVEGCQQVKESHFNERHNFIWKAKGAWTWVGKTKGWRRW